jgi:hypothetical protein
MIEVKNEKLFSQKKNEILQLRIPQVQQFICLSFLFTFFE